MSQAQNVHPNLLNNKGVSPFYGTHAFCFSIYSRTKVLFLFYQPGFCTHLFWVSVRIRGCNGKR